MPEERKTQPVPKVYPFDRDTLRIITGNPEATLSRTRVSMCEICGKIPERTSLTERGPVSEAAASLAVRAEIKAGLMLLRCPRCGCLYKLERLAGLPPEEGGSEEAMTRLQPGDAFELLLGQEAKFILRYGEQWSLKW